MIALAAIFVLLVQALAPAFAVAGPTPDGAGVICTDMGVQRAPNDPAAPAVDHACKHCVCPVTRVAYVVAQTPAAAISRTLPPPARGPPRPPGQGPPTSDA